MGINGKHFYRFTYLKSEEWHTARIVALAKSGAKCAICGKVSWKNDAHHRKYPSNIWETTFFHLIVLCRECHAMIHSTFGKPSNKRWRVIRHRARLKYLNTHPIECRKSCYFCRSTDVVKMLCYYPRCQIWVCGECIGPFQEAQSRAISPKRTWMAIRILERQQESAIALMFGIKWFFRKRHRRDLNQRKVSDKELARYNEWLDNHKLFA